MFAHAFFDSAGQNIMIILARNAGAAATATFFKKIMIIAFGIYNYYENPQPQQTGRGYSLTTILTRGSADDRLRDPQSRAPYGCIAVLCSLSQNSPNLFVRSRTVSPLAQRWPSASRAARVAKI